MINSMFSLCHKIQCETGSASMNIKLTKMEIYWAAFWLNWTRLHKSTAFYICLSWREPGYPPFILPFKLKTEQFVFNRFPVH